MKRLHTHSQHFLRGSHLIAELIGHSNIHKNDTVYDLGAGSGAISSVLAGRCREVVAVEIEPQALAKLRDNMKEYSNVSVVAKDILELTPPSKPYKIFSNIPFSLSAQIVRKYTETERPPEAIYFIVQKQFAQKLVPSNTRFTAQLGAQIGPRFSAQIRRPLRRTDFTPPPAVDTVLLELKLRPTPLLPVEQLPHYREFVGRCFAEQKFFAKVPRVKAGISPEFSPSQLSIEQWCTLWKIYKNS
jgi:23S rRNA (adenine-N6)-dimethyltransferase